MPPKTNAMPIQVSVFPHFRHQQKQEQHQYQYQYHSVPMSSSLAVEIGGRGDVKDIPLDITFPSAHHSPNTVNRNAKEFVIGTVRLNSVSSEEPISIGSPAANQPFISNFSFPIPYSPPHPQRNKNPTQHQKPTNQTNKQTDQEKKERKKERKTTHPPSQSAKRTTRSPSNSPPTAPRTPAPSTGPRPSTPPSAPST